MSSNGKLGSQWLEILLMIAFFLAPLFPPAVALWVHDRSSPGLRIPLIFAGLYALSELSAFAYVWYCFSAGYQDWIMANIVPQGIAFLAIPISWVAFIFSFRNAPKGESHPEADS